MAIEIFSGTYEGDGVDDRDITGVGFQGNWIVIIPDDTEYTFMKTSANTGASEATQYMAPNMADEATNRVQAFIADGFTLGDDVDTNQNGITYAYTIMKFDAADSMTTSYTGNGGDNYSITGVGFQPTCVITKGAGGRYGAFLTPEMGTNNSAWFSNFSANSADAIQQLEADGFELGAFAATNTNGELFWYEAFLDVADVFETGEYTGDGNDNRTVTVGFQPEFVMVNEDGLDIAMIRNDQMGIESKGVLNGGGWAGNIIQSLDANGFTVGNETYINQNGATYYWMAWKTPIVPPPVTAAIMTTNTKFWG